MIEARGENVPTIQSEMIMPGPGRNHGTRGVLVVDEHGGARSRRKEDSGVSSLGEGGYTVAFLRWALGGEVGTVVCSSEASGRL